MVIMSYNTDLQTNNVNLQAILDTVNNLPGAGGSGATLKTCTLDGLDWSTVYYTTVENGTIMYKAVTFGNSSEPITVLCDSIIYYEADGDSDPGTGVVLTGGFEELYSDTRVKYIVIKAPSTANASGMLILSSDPVEEEIPGL